MCWGWSIPRTQPYMQTHTHIQKEGNQDLRGSQDVYVPGA